MSKKTIGGQKDRRSKKIQRNTSESGIKSVCLNARSIINKKTKLNIMVDDIKHIDRKPSSLTFLLGVLPKETEHKSRFLVRKLKGSLTSSIWGRA